MILIDATLTSPKKMTFLICLCVLLTAIRNQQTQGNYNKNVYCVYEFAFI